MPKRPQHWVPNQPLSTGRLAWLAAREELRHRSSPWWLIFIRVGSSQTATATDTSRSMSAEIKGDKMADYALPIDRVAERLNPTEINALRLRGELPEWFYEAVEKERKAIRRGR